MEEQFTSWCPCKIKILIDLQTQPVRCLSCCLPELLQPKSYRIRNRCLTCNWPVRRGLCFIELEELKMSILPSKSLITALNRCHSWFSQSLCLCTLLSCFCCCVVRCVFVSVCYCLHAIVVWKQTVRRLNLHLCFLWTHRSLRHRLYI